MNEEMRMKIYDDFRIIAALNHKFMYNKLEGISIYPGQPVLIKSIIENEGISQVELAKMCYKEPATVTTMLQKMEKLGYIKRIQDGSDKRITRLYVTDKGKELDNKFHNIVKEISNKTFEGITNEELDCIYTILQKIKNNLVTQ